MILNRNRQNPRIIVFALILVFTAFSAASAQWNSDYYIGTVQPNLTTQNQAYHSAQSKKTAGQTAPPHSSEQTSEKKTESVKNIEALLVSIDHYDTVENVPKSDRWPPLSGCNNDTRAIKSWLDRLGPPAPTVTVLCDDASLSNKKPDCATILSELKRISKHSCDRLFVTFACHGTSIGNKSFVCPADSSNIHLATDDKSNEVILKAARDIHLLPISDILDILKESNAKEVILILDTCRGEGTGDFMREFQDLLKDVNKSFKKSGGGSFAVITSCSFGQEANELVVNESRSERNSSSETDSNAENPPPNDGQADDDGAQNSRGAFFYYFITGLSGWADYTGCYDGEISLAEAYNYAYSRVSDFTKDSKNGPQTPEIFVASETDNIVLTNSLGESEAETDDPAVIKERLASLSDLQFLMRVGSILTDNYRSVDANRVGIKALNSVLDNIPNYTLAYAQRGSARRRLGLYDEALNDMNRIGQKFQLYAKSDNAAVSLRKTPEHEETIPGVHVKNQALLTIDDVNGHYFHVTEINNNPEGLGENGGWIHRDSVMWDRKLAKRSVTATQFQAARVIGASTGSMIQPGISTPTGGSVMSGPGPVYH